MVTACGAPDQNDPVRFGTYGINLDPPTRHRDSTLDAEPWRPDQVELIQRCYKSLERLGPRFTFVAGESRAQFTLRPYNAAVDSGIPGQVGHTLSKSVLECDPTRTPGYDALCACIGHEMGHLLDMEHVCQKPGDFGECSPVGYGVAIMNPSTIYGDGTARSAQMVQEEPDALDLAEFRRARERNSP